MTSMLSLGWIVGCVFGDCVADIPVAPPPREKSMFKCDVRLTNKPEGATGAGKHTVYSIGISDVTITNNSGADVDIGSQWGPNAFLNLRVKGPDGADVKTEPFSSLLAIQSFRKSKPYILKSGDIYHTSVNLLAMVPFEKRVAGTYKVKAVYEIGKKEYESAWVEVKWPGNEK